MLSDHSIAALVRSQRIVIDPPPALERLQPASVDVTLGNTVRLYDDARYRRVRLTDIPDDLTTEYTIGEDGLSLRPGDFLLATTAERVALPDDVCAFLHGRSTLGRLGLLVHATAGLIDPGFDGAITLEVANIGELVLVLAPGDVIGQLTFERMSTAALRPYGSTGLGSHYQHQDGPTPPRSVVPAAEPVVAPVVALRPGDG